MTLDSFQVVSDCTSKSLPIMLPIPHDLIISVVDEVRDDCNTLQACAIVSRSFRAPSQRHLFSAIQIRDFGSSPPNTSEICRRFHNLLETSPHIASYVRNITILDTLERSRVENTHSRRSSREYEHWVLAEPALPHVLRMLPCLKVLYFKSIVVRGLSWDLFSTELRFSFLHLLRTPTLTTVELSGLTIPIALFTYAPQLTELRLLSCSVRRQPDIKLLSPQFPDCPAGTEKVQIKLLTMCATTSTEGLTETLHSVFDLPRLSTLAIVGSRPGTLMVAQNISTLAAGSLESFRWTMPGDQITRLSGPINISFMPNLRRLELGVDFWSGRYEPIPFSWLFQVLGDLARSKAPGGVGLETLIIGVSLIGYSGDELDFLVGYDIWSSLDDLLTAAAFSKLHEVIIYLSSRIWGRDFVERWTMLMKGRLPCLDAKRILHLTTLPWDHELRANGTSTSRLQQAALVL